MTRFARPGIVIATLAVAACDRAGLTAAKASNATPSTSLGGGFGTVPPPSTSAQHAGTVTWAESPGTAPTWILPIITSAAFTVYDTNQFSYLMWRPLYWMSNGVQPTETPAMSLANPPKWSNGNKTATVTLKSNYKWSDGQPVTSKDVLFFFDEIKAAIKENASNWGPYTPGLGIPDEVASLTAPSANTVVFTLKKPVNPQWFWYNQLSNVIPMPAHAWARASAGSPILDFTNPANAKKIWDYLNKQAMSLSTDTSNPLWKTVDGPYKLTQFNNTTGAAHDDAEPGRWRPARQEGLHTAGRAVHLRYRRVQRGPGCSIDMGYLPLDDIKQVETVKQGGYNVFGYPSLGFTYVTYNFLDKTGHFNNVIAQLYFRQAFAHLENEPGYIKAFFGGAGGLAYGPVPSVPKSPYTPANAVKNPYPFSVSTTVKILKSHGWNVVPGGTDTCAKPGAGADQCGAGIPAGTKLAFNLIYATSPSYLGEMVTDLASPGGQGRDPDPPAEQQLQLHHQQLRQPDTERQAQHRQVGDGGLRRVHQQHLPDPAQHLQPRRAERGQLQQPDRHQADPRVGEQRQPGRGEDRGVVPDPGSAEPLPAEPRLRRGVEEDDVGSAGHPRQPDPVLAHPGVLVLHQVGSAGAHAR